MPKEAINALKVFGVWIYKCYHLLKKKYPQNNKIDQ